MTLVVLTGGPHSGKTTLIDALAERGHPVVREAAIDVVSTLDPAWRAAHPAELQARISAEQAAREAAARRAHPDATVYLDRGLVDGVAYSRVRGHAPPAELQAALSTARYDRVFLLDLILPFVDRAETGRRDDEAFAHELDRELERAWRAFGAPLLRVPAGPVPERLRLVDATVRGVLPR